MAKETQSETAGAQAAEDPLVGAMQRNLARAVQMSRWEEGWSRRHLAASSGLSERFIADVERGVANPSLSSLAALSKALGLTVGELLSGWQDVDPVLGRLLRDMPLYEQRDLIKELQAKRGELSSRSHRGRRVALIGLRGAGKTTVGRLLAKQLECDFVELDARIEETAQLPLAQIFEVHGDAYYRRLEAEALRDVLRAPESVIATGGGIVSRADTFATLRDGAHTVWLKAKPEEHLARVLKQGDRRPMEKRPHALAELKALLAAREPAYRQAELTVDTSGTTPEEAVRRIASWLDRVERRPAQTLR